MLLTGETEVLREKRAPLLVRQPQISLALVKDLMHAETARSVLFLHYACVFKYSNSLFLDLLLFQGLKKRVAVRNYPVVVSHNVPVSRRR